MLKILVVGKGYPWKADTGGQMRTTGILKSLGDISELTYCAIMTQSPTTTSDLNNVTHNRILHVVIHKRSFLVAWLIWAWRIVCIKAVPISLCYSRGLKTMTSIDYSEYDVIWLCTPDVERIVHQSLIMQLPVNVIVDMYDLQEQRLTQQANLHKESVGMLSKVLDGIKRSYLMQEAKAWHEIERTIAGGVRAVVVTNDHDKMCLESNNVTVIPNGYQYQSYIGCRKPNTEPRLMFQGSMNYPPNSDAAFYFVDDILPRLVEIIGGNFSVRIVGKPPKRLDRIGMVRDIRELASRKHIVVTGYVKDIADELSRADIVIVPLRQGSGTRIKILEAWAHQVPVVSTSIGADGLGAIHNEHLLIADDPDSFAEACRILLVDNNTRERLVDNGYRLFKEKYCWDAINPRIKDLVDAIVS